MSIMVENDKFAENKISDNKIEIRMLFFIATSDWRVIRNLDSLYTISEFGPRFSQNIEYLHSTVNPIEPKMGMG